MTPKVSVRFRIDTQIILSYGITAITSGFEPEDYGSIPYGTANIPLWCNGLACDGFDPSDHGSNPCRGAKLPYGVTVAQLPLKELDSVQI